VDALSGRQVRLSMARLKQVVGERSRIHEKLLQYRKDHLVDEAGNLKFHEPPKPKQRRPAASEAVVAERQAVNDIQQ
jgi:hypothetical protein